MRKPPAADNDPISLIPPGYCPHYGQKSGFPDSCRRILPLTTGRNPVSLIPAVGFCLSLRVKMAELYFLPYKATKIYGTGTEISFFGRSKLSISTGQHAILLISARRSLPLWAGRIQAGTLFLCAGQQMTGTGLNRNKNPSEPVCHMFRKRHISIPFRGIF